MTPHIRDIARNNAIATCIAYHLTIRHAAFRAGHVMTPTVTNAGENAKVQLWHCHAAGLSGLIHGRDRLRVRHLPDN